MSRPTARTLIWYVWSGGRRRLADLARGDLHVLLAQGIDHVRRR